VKEYAVYGHIRGIPDSELEQIGKLHASSAEEALRIAKAHWLSYTPTKVKFLGELNEKWIPEEALKSAIFDEEYTEKRFTNRKR
jgi:hypothetical protein